MSASVIKYLRLCKLEVTFVTSSNAIGMRIVMLCQERGITIEQLALKMSTDSRHVISVISGNEKSVSLNFIGEVCVAFEITMSEFFHHSLFDA